MSNTRDNAWSKVLVNLYIYKSVGYKQNWTRLRDAQHVARGQVWFVSSERFRLM